MISVIVPVFRVEPYLEQCLDSIIGQTYSDLEILLIDNDSPDRCGAICDRYAAADPRIRVFHAENKGLSAARNLGIEYAHGAWLSFVDSDDWIEPNMLERLMEAAEKNQADIAVCGRVMEYPDKKEIVSPSPGVLNRDEAVKALALLEIRNPAWDKLWKKECFEIIRFPEGRVYEDIATTYRVFLGVDKVMCIPEALYHYRIRDDSISHDGRLDHLVDYYISSREEYENITSNALFKENEEIKEALFSRCMGVVFQIWSSYLYNSKEEREKHDDELQQISQFVRRSFRANYPKNYSIVHRAFGFICCYPSWWSYSIAAAVKGIHKKLHNMSF